MADIQFYHLLSTSLERALPKLLEKALAGEFRVLVRVESEARGEQLNTELWTYNPNNFLPHGTAKDGFAEEQPIYITAGQENPNNANLLVITDGSKPESFNGFTRMLDIFDGANDDSVTKARARWSQYKNEGHNLTYIKQTSAGGWEKMAESAA